MTARPVWGHDPGWNDGAAVLLTPDGKQALAAVTWHRLGRKAGAVYRVRWWCVDDEDALVTETPSLVGVGEFARWLGTGLNEQPWVVVSEGLYGSALKLAYAAGMVDGQLLVAAEGEARRPRWVKWTREVGAPRGKAAKVNPWLVEEARRRWPELGGLLEVEHVVDAAWLAWWGTLG